MPWLQQAVFRRRRENETEERLPFPRLGTESQNGYYTKNCASRKVLIHDEVAINAGHLGVHAFMSPEDIAELLDANLLDLAQ